MSRSEDEQRSPLENLALWKYIVDKSMSLNRGQSRRYHADLKIDVLTVYGPNHKLKCSWPDCDVTDPDMLSLDHIDNNGHSERKMLKGPQLYRHLRQLGYPLGYQTLCFNHQWKKELMRRRKV